jgi:hypothetical protein
VLSLRHPRTLKDFAVLAFGRGLPVERPLRGFAARA